MFAQFTRIKLNILQSNICHFYEWMHAMSIFVICLPFITGEGI